MILDSLKQYTLKKAGASRIKDIRMGLGYTAAQLENGDTGLAYTFRDSLGGGCSVFTGARPLAGRTIEELLQYLSSSLSLERTVGLAVANAVLNMENPAFSEGDILECLDITKDDTVGMVGYFAPLIPGLQRRAKQLHIFEKIPDKAENLLPADLACDVLPNCSVVLITATALINQTFEHVISLCSNCRIKAVLGASTPLSPEVFMAYGVTLLSGVIVTNPGGILRTVSEGGGMRFFKGLIRKVNLPVP
jgi:uncharacterized protein (DUF4213/DUF364 family)